MDRDLDKDFHIFILFMTFSVLCFVSFVTFVAYKTANTQADVYKRQGIEMSAWECFWGAKPAEYNINIREK